MEAAINSLLLFANFSILCAMASNTEEKSSSGDDDSLSPNKDPLAFMSPFERECYDAEMSVRHRPSPSKCLVCVFYAKH